MSRRRNAMPTAQLALEAAPATPAQWEAWCWLWRRLLQPQPAEAPREPEAASDAAPQAAQQDKQARACAGESDVERVEPS